MRTVTKIAFIIVLVTITIVPIVMWAACQRSLADVAAFVAACAAPMGVLTGAMAYRNVQRDRANNTPGPTN